MIDGHVDDSIEPILTLSVKGSTDRVFRVSFVVDTGFSGELSLPSKLVQDLDLEWIDTDFAVLADGSVAEYDAFRGHVEWDGVWIRTVVDQADTAPLLGTALLRGYELTAQMRPHGRLSLKKLPPKRRKRT